MPTGRLRIFVERGYGKVWTFEERVEAPLEAKLNALFVGLWKQVVRCRQKTRDEEARERRAAVLAAERAEVERQARVEAARREAERKRRVLLLKEARAWRRANQLREYVAAVRAASAGDGETADSGVEDWAAWALAVARETDSVGRRTDAPRRGASG